MPVISANNVYDAIEQLLSPIAPTFTDYVQPRQAMPYVLIRELFSNREYFTRSTSDPTARNVIVHSEFSLALYHQNRETCRVLGLEIEGMLDDPALVYNSGRLMYMNPMEASFTEQSSIGIEAATGFQYVMRIRYNEQRAL